MNSGQEQFYSDDEENQVLSKFCNLKTETDGTTGLELVQSGNLTCMAVIAIRLLYRP